METKINNTNLGPLMYLKLFLALLLILPIVSQAGTRTAATGGNAISADTAANASTPAWTTLTGPSYTETIHNDLKVGTVVLTAPAAFEFDVNATVYVRLRAGDPAANKNINNTLVGGDIASTLNGTVTVTATTISFNVNSPSVANARDSIEWIGIQVRPRSGTGTTSGQIIASGTSGIATSAGTNQFGLLARVAGAPKHSIIVLPGQSFVNGSLPSGQAYTIAAGVSSTYRIIATDQFYTTTAAYTGTKSVVFSGPSESCSSGKPNYPTSLNFNNGVVNNLPVTLIKAEVISLTVAAEGLTGVSSSTFTVSPNSTRNYSITLPGQTFVECAGPVGVASDQIRQVDFVIPSIRVVDPYYNTHSTYNLTKTLIWQGAAGTPSFSNPVVFRGGISTSPLNTRLDTIESLTLSVTDGADNGIASSLFSVTAATSIFDAYDTSTPTGSTVGRIKTKVAGAGFSVDVIAKATADGSPSATFTGTVQVQLVDASATGNSCEAWPVVLALPNQTFTASNAGRLTIANIVVLNVWKNIRLRMTSTNNGVTVTYCSTDNFAVRPARFSPPVASDNSPTTAGTARVLNNTNPHRAGRPFSIRVDALNATGTVVTNYTGIPTITLSACNAANCPDISRFGTLSLGSISTVNGSSSSNNATYDDAGAFGVQASDTSFSDVDTGDSSENERLILSDFSTVGRFTPDHFVISASIATPRTDIASCNSSSFTYMNEPFSVGFTITAYSAAPINKVTQNYQSTLAMLNPLNHKHLLFGAVDAPVTKQLTASVVNVTRGLPTIVTSKQPHGFSTGTSVFLSGFVGVDVLNGKKLPVTVISPTQFSIGVDSTDELPYVEGGYASRLFVKDVAGVWNSGIANITASLVLLRDTAPDGPFLPARISVSAIDADGITLRSAAINTDIDGDGTSDMHGLTSMEQRFGLLKLNSSYGVGLNSTELRLESMFWNKTGFVRNNQDNCTNIAASSFSLENYQGGLIAAMLPIPSITGNRAFANGTSTIKLAKPTIPIAKKGSADIRINLDVDNKEYLQGRGNGLLYNINPSARVTLGIYKSAPVIFMREMF